MTADICYVFSSRTDSLDVTMNVCYCHCYREGNRRVSLTLKKKLTVVHPLIGAHNLFLGRKSLLHFTCFLASTFPSEKSSYLILLFVRMIIITKARLLSHTWLFCKPMNCNPSDFSVLGIFQARILEWVTISSSRRSCQPRDWTCISRIAADSIRLSHWGSPGNGRVGRRGNSLDGCSEVREIRNQGVHWPETRWQEKGGKSWDQIWLSFSKPALAKPRLQD